jgi:rhodanese-related sulfurtransferase
MRIPPILRRVRFRARLPSSAALALVLAAVLFAGGFAAGQETQGAGEGGSHELERQAAPLAGGVGAVTPEQVLAVNPESYLLVDVRGRDAFDFSHATDALSMPESELAALARTLPTDRTLVLYCTCPDEKTSLRAARTLIGVFHVTNVVVLVGGLDAYTAAGGAVTSAATDSGVEHQGCGCSTDAPAFKLWVVNSNEQRAAEQSSGDE